MFIVLIVTRQSRHGHKDNNMYMYMLHVYRIDCFCLSPLSSRLCVWPLRSVSSVVPRRRVGVLCNQLAVINPLALRGPPM